MKIQKYYLNPNDSNNERVRLVPKFWKTGERAIFIFFKSKNFTSKRFLFHFHQLHPSRMNERRVFTLSLLRRRLTLSRWFFDTFNTTTLISKISHLFALFEFPHYFLQWLVSDCPWSQRAALLRFLCHKFLYFLLREVIMLSGYWPGVRRSHCG